MEYLYVQDLHIHSTTKRKNSTNLMYTYIVIVAEKTL